MNTAESLGVGSIWLHRAKEEFESDFGFAKRTGKQGRPEEQYHQGNYRREFA